MLKLLLCGLYIKEIYYYGCLINSRIVGLVCLVWELYYVLFNVFRSFLFFLLFVFLLKCVLNVFLCNLRKLLKIIIEFYYYVICLNVGEI